MIQTVFDNMSIEEELPFINVKELCEEETRFKVESIFIKENVITKFKPEGQTVAYVKIHIGDDTYIVSIKQSVLLKKFTAMKEAREADADQFGPDADYVILSCDGKKGNTYYDLFVDDGKE